jgi:hypothetical protein
MKIEHRVRMGEERDAIQEELESEPLSNSDDGEELEDVESADSMFVIGPHDAGASGTRRTPRHRPVLLRRESAPPMGAA